MFQLLFLVLLVEGAATFLLLVDVGPLRELVIRGLDQLKMGKGPPTVKTIAATMCVILLSSIMSIVRIQNKGVKIGTLSPVDQVLWRTHLLEASLMGFTLFLGFLMDRIHYYVRLIVMGGYLRKEAEESVVEENRQLKGKAESVEEENRQLRAKAESTAREVTALRDQVSDLSSRLNTADAHVSSLQRQSEELLLQYDLLLQENQKVQQVMI